MTGADPWPDVLSAVPERPSDITARWLEAALGAPAGSLQDYAVTRIGEGSGIVGTIARATLGWKAGAGGVPASVVVKLGTGDGQPSPRALGTIPVVADAARLAAGAGAACDACLFQPPAALPAMP